MRALGSSRAPRFLQMSRVMALAHPDRIEALIVQDAVAHNEGLGANWKTRRAFLGRPRRQRKRVAHQPPVVANNADAPCRK